ncbi:MAG: hypothetical protein ACI4F0_07510 [Agathobacter sp.]
MTQDKKGISNNKIRNILIGIGAVGTVVLLGIAFPSEPNEHSDSSNASVAAGIEADNTISDQPSDNTIGADEMNSTPSGSEDAFVADMDHLFDGYYTNSVTHNGKVLSDEESFNQWRFNNLYEFINICGYELEEIHDTDPNRRLEMMKEFIGLPKDGSRRLLIDSCNGDTKKMFGYMFLSLCADKYVRYNNEPYMDKISDNNYGMEYWIRLKDKDNNNLTGDIFDNVLELYIRYMNYFYKLTEQGYTYEEAVNIIDNESQNGKQYLTSKEVEEFEDIAYTIFDNFYKEQGIDDYYYILDNEEDYAQMLIEDIESKDKSTYIPMKDRGGYEYQKNLYKSLAP